MTPVEVYTLVRKHLKGFLESGVQEDAATNMKVSITPGHYAALKAPFVYVSDWIVCDSRC